MRYNDHFSSLGAGVLALYFLGAVVFSVIGLHPVLLGLSFLSALAYYACTAGPLRALKSLGAVLPFLLLFCIVNPLLNNRGATELMRVWGRSRHAGGGRIRPALLADAVVRAAMVRLHAAKPGQRPVDRPAFGRAACNRPDDRPDPALYTLSALPFVRPDRDAAHPGRFRGRRWPSSPPAHRRRPAQRGAVTEPGGDAGHGGVDARARV